MPAKTEDTIEEVRQLRSCLNDLLSLLALPAMWNGREPSQIIETLLDSLLAMLRLDFIYARLSDLAGDSPIEAARIAQRRSTHQPHEIGRALESCLTPGAFASPLVVSNPVGEGQVRLARYSLGLREETGLVVAGSQRPDFPTDAESLLMRVAANQAAIALEGARLATQRKKAEDALREQTEVVETINRIGQTLSAELDQQLLVQAVTDAATELTGASFGSFFYNVVDMRGESYVLYTLSGAPREAFAHFPMPRNTDIFGPTFRGEGVIRIADVKKDPRYGKNSPYYGMPPGHLPVTSYLAVPVVSRSGEVLGGLFFGHPDAGVFTERHERIIEGLAAQAAIAMDNARLFELAQRERAEAEAAQKQVANILESVTDSFSVYDREWRITYLNKEAEKLLPRLGLTREEVLGRNLWQVFPDLARSAVYEQYHRAIAEQVPVELELFYPPLNSWYEVRAYPSKEGLAVYSQDITERKRVEESLRRAKEFDEAVMSNMGEGLYTVDELGMVTFMNPGAEKLLGWTLDELRGRKMHDVTHYKHPDGSPFPAEDCSGLQVLRRGNALTNHEDVFVRKDGTFLDVVYSSSPLREGDKITGLVVVFRDVTERKHAEEALRASENQLRMVTDNIPVFIVYCDTEQRYRFVNKGYAQRFGIGPDQIVGKRIPDVLGEKAYASVKRHVDLVLEGQATEFEVEIPYESIGPRYMHCAYVPDLDGDGNVKGFFALISDATERKLSEEALRQSEQRYRQLIHALPAAIYACDTEGRVTLYNEAAVDLWGREPEVGKDLWCGSWKIYEPDGSPLPLEECPMAVAIQEGRPVLGQEIVIERPDGARRFVLPYPDPIRDAHGTVVGAVNMLVDLTERKQMEQEREQLLAGEQAARAEAERRWRESRLLTAATRQFSASLQFQDLVPAICQAAREIADADGASFVLREGDQVYYSEEDAIEPLWKGQRFPINSCISGWAILERKPAVVEDIYADQRLPIEAYQSTFVKSLVMVPVRSHDPLGAIGVYWKQRRKADDREVALLEALADAAHIALINTHLYEQTKAAREQAEDANRLKDEFLATVSHELRTPLNAMLGWTRMLRIGKLDEKTNERALETIERNAKSQAQLIEDLLDVSRVISGKMRLDVQPVELAPVIQAAIDSVRPAADAKSIRLSMVIDPKAGPVSGDPTRLQQIVWNLVSNAIKFTPKDGRVQVRLERVSSHLEITVSDSGIGIKPDFLPHVFDRFRQADSTLTRRQGGLGLGLAIARHLVELHGGNIYASSAGEGQGATFTIKLPPMVVREAELFPIELSERKHPAAWPDVPFECPSALNGLRVLIVDDEPDARQLLTTILEQCKAKVTVAASVGEALDGLEQLKPDVLVSDIEMPGEDGYCFIRKVRAMESGQNGRIPAAALTAHAGVADRMRALSAGFDIHVPKPVEPAELVAVIASLTSRIAKRTGS